MLLDPVFCLKRRHALEFSEVVRYQHKSFAARMGGNVQIIDADDLTLFLKRCTDGSILLCGLRCVGQYFKAAGEVVDGAKVVCHPRALLRTM